MEYNVYAEPEPEEPISQMVVLQLDPKIGELMMLFIKNNPKVLELAV